MLGHKESLMPRPVAIKCANGDCPSILYAEDEGYQVRIVDGTGEITCALCCCPDCASAVQQRWANVHRERLNAVEQQSFQRMAVSRFFPNVRNMRMF